MDKKQALEKARTDGWKAFFSILKGAMIVNDQDPENIDPEFVEYLGMSFRFGFDYGADIKKVAEDADLSLPDISLRQLQNEVGPWALRNFGEQASYRPLLGIGEEVGELNHAHLKAEQGIRGTAEEHAAAKVDAIGDLLVYMAHYCALEGIDLQEAINVTWRQVRQRDWKKDSAKGGE